MTTLRDPKVASAIDRMYAESAQQMTQLHTLDWQHLSSASPRERSDALRDYYLPVTPESGLLLYTLVRAAKPQTVVEFGMSLGLSTIHLAAAVRDNGVGHVITSELSAAKVAAATATFAEVGLTDVITVEEGDALQTLGALDGPVNFVLLDGWKELYLPVLQLLEPKLSSGALVVADNTGMADTQPYLDYVRDPARGFVSVAFPVRDGNDAMEISCRA
ncbi:O-methyltransferase [Mycobacterium sp. DL592]|uniref:O-methyltransferase n=1 Tax=Mycobacterium sp. DL592 TaxID=2675524 RepID=UPI001FB9B518|nr:class I SAM-dependent methyltransferase [Mycobacterium sp. DL592]